MTVRLEAQKYCLYEHSFGGVVFYVGVGVSTRPFERVKRNALWNAYVAMIGGAFDVTILQWSDDRVAVLRAEAARVAKVKPECNQMLNGYTHTPERKAKTSATHKGKQWSPESRAKLSASRQGIVPWNKGASATGIQLANLALRQAGTPVRCVETGQEFASVREAVEQLGLARGTLRAHLAGRTPHVRGMTFEVLARGLSGPSAGTIGRASAPSAEEVKGRLGRNLQP